ncbi:MAG: hypothetical protein D6795_11880 [Deltaproteobacteria bacterium]|nr:MAG: hypothetical protein D6795_11880 [Deltaproteobacteria bacterium]
MERRFLVQPGRSFREIGEALLTFGVGWVLHETGILSFKALPPKATVAVQGTVSPKVIFNFVPLDVVFNGSRVSCVAPGSVAGEGGFFGVPRTAALKVPVTKASHEDPCVALLHCDRLQEKMPTLYEAFRLEVFIAFLEKLQQANQRRQLETLEWKRRGITPEPPKLLRSTTQVSFDPVETLWNSPIFSVLSDPEEIERCRRAIEGITVVERYRRGETLIPIHVDPEKIFVVHAGEVSVRGERGECFVRLGPGHVIGESIITGTPTIAAVVAESEEVTICAIYEKDLLASPVRSLFFTNCFRILQEKLIASDIDIVEFREKMEVQWQRSQTQIRKGHSAPPAPSADSPFAIDTGHLFSGEEKRVSPPLRKKPERVERAAPEGEGVSFRRFTSRISKSLEKWLGEDMTRKQNREIAEILDEFQEKLEHGDIRVHRKKY